MPKIKRVLIRGGGVEHQIYPNTLSKSLDLTTMSAAQIQAEGWYLGGKQGASNYSLSSNGLTNAGTSNNSYWVGYKLGDNVVPKKITLNGTWSITSTSTYAGFGSLHYGVNEGFDNYNSGNNLSANYKGGSLDNGNFVVLSNYGAIVSDTGYSGTGTFHGKVIIDLKNKTVEYSTTSPRTYSKSATLTDAQIASMDGWKYLIFGGTLYSTPGSVLKDCSFSVEY